MDAVEVNTVVYVSPEEVYEFLVDFPRYARYSKYLKDVRQYGDGTPGTEYELEFAWWRLSYTARSEVTGFSPPTRIDWRLTKDLDAVGSWQVEAVEDADRQPASMVTFYVKYRPESANESALQLPRFVSLEWVIEKVEPRVRREAERVVRRIVADLEGEPRDVDLEITTT